MYLLAAGAISGALLLGAGTPQVDHTSGGSVAALVRATSVVVDVVVAAYVVSLAGLALMCAMARLRRKLTEARW